MRIRLSIPDHHVDRDTLDAALEATTRVAERQIRSGEAPDVRELIESRAVRWKPEPFTDGEHFDLPATFAARGWADCDDLAPALAGSLRASGEDPGATATAYRSGRKTWHCVVRTSDGRILDPSRWAGMKRGGVLGARAAPMALGGDSGIAVVPFAGGWAARCDLPWPSDRRHWTSTARNVNPATAMADAVIGACEYAHAIGDHDAASRATETAELLLPALHEASFLDPRTYRRRRMYRDRLPNGASVLYRPDDVAPLIARF